MRGIPVDIIASVRNGEEIDKAVSLGADMIEIRLDLLTEPKLSPEDLEGRNLPPLVLTMRGMPEGGAYIGDSPEWRRSVEPWLSRVEYVDVEQVYRSEAGDLRSRGKKVIASWHSPVMPSLDELQEKEKDLRAYGEIPKLVVTPSSSDDLLTLLFFTLQARKPLCTGILGDRFRYGRLLVSLFGSGFAYCHVGNPTAAGQYHMQDFRTLMEKLLE